MSTRFAVPIPQSTGVAGFDPDTFRAYLRRAEDLGFDSAWVGEQVLGDAPMLGPIETLTYAAACTQRLRLGCAALVSSLAGPVHLAKSLSTLDQLSGGRLEVGVTTGGPYRPFAAFGVDAGSFVARFTEGVQLMRELWRRPRVDFDGRFWQLADAAMEPKPLQPSGPPIWIGGGHPDAVRRAVRLADGFFGAGTSTTEQFAEHVRVVRDALAETGRDPAGFRIAKRVYLAVDDDADRARRRVAASLDERYRYFGLRGLDPVAVAGTPADCVRGLREVVHAGAELILLNPLVDATEQMERLATEVVPELG